LFVLISKIVVNGVNRQSDPDPRDNFPPRCEEEPFNFVPHLIVGFWLGVLVTLVAFAWRRYCNTLSVDKQQKM
jgi:hypothetical protein